MKDTTVERPSPPAVPSPRQCAGYFLCPSVLHERPAQSLAASLVLHQSFTFWNLRTRHKPSRKTGTIQVMFPSTLSRP
jgi:hypothetical protein